MSHFVDPIGERSVDAEIKRKNQLFDEIRQKMASTTVRLEPEADFDTLFVNDSTLDECPFCHCTTIYVFAGDDLEVIECMQCYATISDPDGVW